MWFPEAAYVKVHALNVSLLLDLDDGGSLSSAQACEFVSGSDANNDEKEKPVTCVMCNQAKLVQ